jgi:hypothetical protein
MKLHHIILLLLNILFLSIIGIYISDRLNYIEFHTIIREKQFIKREDSLRKITNNNLYFLMAEIDSIKNRKFDIIKPKYIDKSIYRRNQYYTVDKDGYVIIKAVKHEQR